MTPTQQSSLFHLVRLPGVTAEDTNAQPPLLLLLHGVGSNEEDLFGFESALDARFVVVSARAPNVLGPGAYAWFQVQFTPSGPVINPEQAEASRVLLIKFIEEIVKQYHADPRRVYLMGFSQGAIMSASIALTQPELVAGAVLMSGRILPEIREKIASKERLARLPVLVVHGTGDTTLPIQHGRASRELLTTLAVKLDYREYAMGHGVSDQSLNDVTRWLTARLNATDSGGAA